MDIQQLYELYRRQGAITTDSRTCPAGSIFVALKGARFDGNQFASAALSAGCAYAVVDDARHIPHGDGRYILVDSGLRAYQQIARLHRREFSIPIIAITGTNGKTTTKELVAAVLSMERRVLSTEANYNNDIGVAQTLLRLGANHEIGVVEMGASHPGDIRTLAEMAEPTCGLITNVGKAHLAGFGSFEGVARAKGELFDYLRRGEGTVAFVDAGNALLMTMAHDLELATYSAATEAEAQVEGKVEAMTPLLSFAWWRRGAEDEARHVTTRLVGGYNLCNMLAAVRVGLHFGINPDDIDYALAHYEPGNDRSQYTATERNRLIVDAYNANPTSMAAAIGNFAAMKGDHKMAIIGQMNELGDASPEEHRRIISLLHKSGIEEVWLVGEMFAQALAGNEAETNGTSWRLFQDVEQVKQAIAQECPQGRYVLIKGSNSVKLAQLSHIL